MPKHSPDFYHDQVLSLTRLPTLPAIATEILQITRDDRLSVRQMLPILEKDPPLALRVMKTANSAYYAIREKVESLGRAVVVIGMEELSYIALSFSVINMLSTEENGNQINWERYWQHSVACGHIARVLNKRLRIVNQSGLYAMGLMHDIGKLILFRLEPELFGNVLQTVREEQCTSLEAERTIIGITHEDVGLWIAEKWDFPVSLREAISNHHLPENVIDPQLQRSVALIRIADLLCNYRTFRFGTKFIKSIPEDDGGVQILKAYVTDSTILDFENLALIIDEEVDTIKELAQLTGGN